MKANKSLTWFWAALLIVTVATVAVRFVAQAAETPSRLRVDSTPINRDPQSGNSYSPVIKRVAPSVVNIYSSRIVKQRLYNPWMADPFFRRFFGGQDDGNGREVVSRDNWLGSGMIVTPDGYILTANHVVEGATEIKVGLKNDSTIYSARVIGNDPPTDVAVLKIDAQNLPALTLGDSDKLEVGDVVLAVGNPFGIGQTVTRGIISALGRSLNDERQYQDYIQTDAAINQGNSGGALVDAQGRLIGLNDAMISPSGSSAGIGLAVPINMARSVMEGFLNSGRVARGYLGVGSQDVDPGLAKSFGAPSASGALVTEVSPNSPAALSGVQPGDVIVGINEREITSEDSLRVAVSELAPGSKVNVKVYRNGAAKTFAVTLTERMDPTGGQPVVKADNENTLPPKADALNGVEVQDLDQSLRLQLGTPGDLPGALVVRVDRASNSFEAGLRRGDIITEINHQAVANAKDAERLGRAARTEQIIVKIWHPERVGAGRIRFLSVDNTKR